MPDPIERESMTDMKKQALLDWRKTVDSVLGAGFAAIGALEIKNGRLGSATLALLFTLGFGLDFIQTAKRNRGVAK
jgi:hypothetical protein